MSSEETQVEAGPSVRVWRRHLLEAVTIVGSILLALLLDAGWDWLGDRAQEEEYLTALHTELGASLAELESDLEAHARTFVAEQVEPYLRAHLDLAEVIPRGSDYMGTLDPTPDPSAFNALLDQPEFASLAQLRWDREETAFRFARSLRASIEDAMSLIAAETGQ